jgi:glutamate formiminotransferase
VRDDKAEQQIISESGAISQRDNRPKHRSIEGQHIQRTQPENSSQSERVESHANVVGENLARADLVGFVQTFPPVRPVIDDNLAEVGANSGKFREFGIQSRPYKSYKAENTKDGKGHGRVAPGAPERLRKIASKEISETLTALRVGAINPAMRPNNQTVEIIHQPRIARFGARNCEIRSSPPVDAAELADLFAVQLMQRHPIKHVQQLFQPLPHRLPFVDEAIDGHGVIADFRLLIFDLQFRNRNFEPLQMDQSSIGNQKSGMLVECVPNFSEGRKPDTIEHIAQAISSVAGAVVLNRHIDPDHNRSVITFVAPPEAIVEAALQAVATAAHLIDLRTHAGVHPRIGATDVLPFVPVSGVTIDDCIALAHHAGQRIWNELSIPVYFYERAALRSDRRRLENVRGKGFEWLRNEIRTNDERAPDVGNRELHESAGAIAVGARPFLIAFNINLRTADLAIARRIAHAVREREGGLPFVKALGFELASRGLVQVSMNLIDYEQTTISRAFSAVEQEAERLGVAIAGTEIVGLLPRASLDRTAAYFPLLENFHETLVLETLLESISGDAHPTAS